MHNVFIEVLDEAGQHKRIAVEIIDPRGNEVMWVLHLENNLAYRQ